MQCIESWIRSRIRTEFTNSLAYSSICVSFPEFIRGTLRNELEFIGVVWSVENFKYYLFGKSFTSVTDQPALLSIKKENRFNKSHNSRLTRLLDRFLPFNFNIEHIPGAKMGLVDYISRQPNQQAKYTNKYDEKIAVAKNIRIRDGIAAIYVNHTTKLPITAL